jgi:hypothetical protein
VAGTCECGNESSGSIKCGEFLDWLQTGYFSRRTLLHGVSILAGGTECIQTRLLGATLRWSTHTAL